ncbi:stage III sporulation protein AE, partial [Paenibacillus xylanexedens]|uniref:stage III sporulation protein AE n=1 Tax=Paenibacillus xylanexedens TaxID=528191 RepID=UPI003F7A68AB
MFYNPKFLLTILILTLLTIILHTLHTPFHKNNITNIPYSISYILIILIPINTFTLPIRYPKHAIHPILTFIIPILPLLFT